MQGFGSNQVWASGRILAVGIACIVLMGGFAAADVPPLGPDVPDSAAQAEPPWKYTWKPDQAVAYDFTLEAKVASETLRVLGRTTYRPGAGRLVVDDEGLSGEGTGTGFVIHPEGILVTCAHVVKGATKITTRINGQEYTATVIGLDWEHDLAVLRVPARGLPHLSFADSDGVRLAQEVRAIGYPLSTVLGESIKVTRGEISGIGDSRNSKVLQIDVTVNPGNSGGPLVDSAGRVVGVTSELLVGTDISNVGLAMPANEVRGLAKRLKVPVSVRDSAPELPAPDLVARVTPAVVLLKVDYGAEGVGLAQRQVLTYSGHYSTYSGPGDQAPGVRNDRGALAVDRLGQITSYEGREELPFMLGGLGTVGIETLPASANGKASAITPVLFQRVEQRSSNLPPYDFRSRDRYRPPWQREPERVAIALLEGVETVVYEFGKVDGQRVELKKNYELTMAGLSPDDPPFMTLVGQGVASFDQKLGLVQSMNYQATLTINQDNVTLRMPVRLAYKMKDAEELAKELAEAKARADAITARSRTQVEGASLAPAPAVRPAPGIAPGQGKYPSVGAIAPSPRLDQFQPER